MTVVNPKSISGINSITTGSGSDNLLTIHTNDGTERVRVDSTGTTKIVTGIVTTLTATTGIVTTFVTNTAKVGGGVTISESGIEASGIGITVANINGSQISGRRNLIINGAMNIAQRGTSSTTDGYGSLDRFRHNHTGTDEAPTFSQADVASGTTPYTLGFRKSLKITNGNQTSGAGAADVIQVQQRIEAQDMATSGWNYTSTSSFITLSFWVKSSVAQNFYGYVRTADGTSQNYPFETGSLTADTWTKIVKTIPGNSNITFDNDTDVGAYVYIIPFQGTDYTGSVSLNAWANFASATRHPDMASTWYTTNDATFEITGVQLEVGPQATAFEHRTFGDELLLCQRYYRAVIGGTYTSFPLIGRKSGTDATGIVADMIIFPPMRVHGADLDGTLVSFGGYRRLSDNATANSTGTNTVKILNTAGSGYNYGSTVRFTFPTDTGSTNQQFAHISTTNRLHFQLQAEL